MDKAEHLLPGNSHTPLKDLGEHSWVHWGCSDINATLCQVCLIEDQVAFLQLVKSQFSREKMISLLSDSSVDLLQLSHDTFCPLCGMNPQEVDVRLSRGLGYLFSSPGCFEEVSRTVAVIQQKTGMWHMMWRLRNVLTWEMILLAIVSSLNLFLKYSFFCVSVNPSDLCHHVNALSRDLIGCRRACGYPDTSGGNQVAPDEVCQQHVHWGRLCDNQYRSGCSGSPEEVDTHQTIQDEDNLNRSYLQISASLVSIKKWWRSPTKLNSFPFSKFSSLKVKGNVKSMPWLALPSAQSRVNLRVKMVLPMPASPVVNIVLIGWSCPGKGLKMSSHWLVFPPWLVSWSCFNQSDLMFLVDLSTASLYDEDLCVDLIQRCRLSCFRDSSNTRWVFSFRWDLSLCWHLTTKCFWMKKQQKSSVRMNYYFNLLSLGLFLRLLPKIAYPNWIDYISTTWRTCKLILVPKER